MFKVIYMLFWSCHVVIGSGIDILSHFIQSDYKIKDIRAEIVSFDKNYVNFAKVLTYKYNRSTPAINVTFNTKINIQKDNIEVLVQLYKFVSNEYRHFPVRYQINLWKAFQANAMGIQEAVKCGNMKLDMMEIKRGITYHVCNFVPDERYLPPRAVTGMFKIEYVLYDGVNILGTGNGYGEVYRPIVIKD